MNEKELLKQRMSRDNEYNSFGSDNFKDANTGKEIRMVSERWEYKNYVDNPVSSIDDEIEKLTYNLPDIIDLHQVDIKKIEYDYNGCYLNRYIYKEDLKLQPLGFIRIIMNNIDKDLLTKDEIQTKYNTYEDMLYYEYLLKLPKYLLLIDLTEEQLNNDEELIRKFKNEDIHQNIHLASLPEETLKFLVEKYK